MSIATVINGDARRLPLADGSVHCCICSPPYFGLRDYGTATWEGGSEDCEHVKPADSLGGMNGKQPTNAGSCTVQYRDICGKCGARRVDRQIGLEATPDEFVAAMVAVFREVRRVLHPTGVCFVNLGDSYMGGGPHHGDKNLGKTGTNKGSATGRDRVIGDGLKPKDLIGIPWRVALALQADGWWLRDAIIWSKAEVDDDDVLEGSAMPGSQRDRCTSAYEFVFQFAKSATYYFDAEAIKSKSGAMPRNVWRINPSPWKGAHFATFPPALVERCVKAGTSERGVCPGCGAPWERVVDRRRLLDGETEVTGGYQQDEAGRIGANGVGHWRITTQSTTLGWRPTCECVRHVETFEDGSESVRVGFAHDPVPATVFDPFAGSGTTGVVATGLGRRFVGVELSPDYCRMAVRRISRPHASHRTPRKEESHPLFVGVVE